MMSESKIMKKFRSQAGLSRSLSWRCIKRCRQNRKVLSTVTRYNSPALISRVILWFGVMSGCPSAIAVKQTPATRYRKVNRVKCFISFFLCFVKSADSKANTSKLYFFLVTKVKNQRKKQHLLFDLIV